MKKIITYQTPTGNTLDITPAQCRIFRAAQKWPKNDRGEEYCQISHGLHVGHPDLTDDQCRQIADGTHLSEV